MSSVQKAPKRRVSAIVCACKTSGKFPPLVEREQPWNVQNDGQKSWTINFLVSHSPYFSRSLLALNSYDLYQRWHIISVSSV